MQVEIEILDQFMQWLDNATYKVAVSGRASGKSVSAVDALISLACQCQMKILCCRQFQNSISDSSYALIVDRIEHHGLEEHFEILRDRIICKVTGTLFLFKGLERNIRSIKSIANIDIVFVEEAEAITEESWEVLIPTIIRRAGAQIWVNFNPQRPTDPTAELFLGDNPPEDMILMRSNYDENPYLPASMLREIEYMKQTDYQRYLHVYRGEFLDIGEQKMFPMQLVQDAIGRGVASVEGKVGALDVARFGSDRSVLAVMEGDRILPLVEWKGLSITVLCDMVIEEIHRQGLERLIVDSVGMGAGAFDILNDTVGKICEVVEFNGSYRADDHHYANARAETYGKMKNWLRTGCIPPDRDLIKELMSIEYNFNNKNQIQLESKKEMKKRLKCSPDKADAVTMLFFSHKLPNRSKKFKHFGTSGKKGMYAPRRKRRNG